MRNLPFLLFLFFLPALTQAEETQPSLELLQQALGADAATLQRLEALRTVADCTGPRGAFTPEVFSERPLRIRFQQDSDRGERRLFLDRLGPKIWEQETESWKEAPAGVANFLRGHEFHLMLFELRQRFRDFEESGSEEVDGEICRTLLMKTHDDQRASVCLDPETYRPVALRFPPAPGEASIRIVFQDWKEIEGLWFFQAFTLTQGTDVFTYRYTTLEATWTPADADPTAAQDWTVGEWRGVRRDGGERTPEAEAEMTMRVEPLWSGAPEEGNGQVRRLEIGSYRGFASQLYDPEPGRWVRHYANPVHRRFVRLEGELYGPRSVWQRPNQEGGRRSVLESERLSDGRWLRTMYRSEDGGGTWRILWQDELRRVP